MQVRDLVAEVRALPGGAGVNAQMIRRVVVHLRVGLGLHVCGQTNEGYYMAATVEELNATLRFVGARAMTTLRQRSAMRRHAGKTLPEERRLRT